MKAAVLYGPEDLRYEEVPKPSLGDEEVLVQIRANGLCGSDIHFFEHGELGPYKVTRPYIPGHEACGVVVKAAASGKGPEPGQRVALEPGIPCRRCRYCKMGRYNLCRDVVFLSAPPVNGTFADLVAIPADLAHPLPDVVDEQAGALVEPVSVGLQALTRGELLAGSSLAIVGAGPIGLVILLLGQVFGAAETYIIDRLQNRLELARTLEAVHTIDSSREDPVTALMSLSHGEGADLVVDATGDSLACATTPLLASRGGTVVIVGWPETGMFPFPVEAVIEKELDVRGVNRYCNTYPRAIALMAAGRLDVRPLISHRFPFAEVREAFTFASRNRAQTIKVLVLH